MKTSYKPGDIFQTKNDIFMVVGTELGNYRLVHLKSGRVGGAFLESTRQHIESKVFEGTIKIVESKAQTFSSAKRLLDQHAELMGDRFADKTLCSMGASPLSALQGEVIRLKKNLSDGLKFADDILKSKNEELNDMSIKLAASDKALEQKDAKISELKRRVEQYKRANLQDIGAAERYRTLKSLDRLRSGLLRGRPTRVIKQEAREMFNDED